MGRISNFESFLLEYLNIDDIHKKWYPKMDYETYLLIVHADPTTRGDKMGKYSKWLLGLFFTNEIMAEDLYKFTEYLTLYDKFREQIPVKDINQLKTSSELYKLVEPFMDKINNVFTNDEERKLINQFKEVYRDSDYRIIIPLTLKASKYFGQNTQWCTQYPQSFEEYTIKQTEEITPHNLYILLPVDEGDPEEDFDGRLQLHFRSSMFMDINDMEISIEDFFEKYKKIKIFFDSNFPVLRYIDAYEFFKKGERLSDNDKEAITFITYFFTRLEKKKSSTLIGYFWFWDKSEVVWIAKKIRQYENDDISCRYAGFWSILQEKYMLGDATSGFIKWELEKRYDIIGDPIIMNN